MIPVVATETFPTTRYPEVKMSAGNKREVKGDVLAGM